MSGDRRALVVATYDYDDPDLSRLTSPGHDAESFAAVLTDPEVAGFNVTMLLNEPTHVVAEAIEDFYAAGRSQDLSLLYFSGHGLKDDDGRLYLAMSNTRRLRLRSTGLSATQVNEAMDSSMSRRNVLILDCCYSGAFPAGRTAKADQGVDTLGKFHGKGRAVLTASDATQYAFEGNNLRGAGTSSVFTRYLVEAIRTGEADLDEDGDIALDELYRYVRDRVIAEVPQQRPKKQEDVDGQILIARNVHWTLPLHVRHGIDSPDAVQRLHALSQLEHLHRVGNQHVKAAVRREVAALTDDDSRRVSGAAVELLARTADDGASSRGAPDPTPSRSRAEEDAQRDAEERTRREAADRLRREAAERAAAEQAAAERAAAAERGRVEAEQRAAARAEAEAEAVKSRKRARQETDEREAEERQARWEATQREVQDSLRQEEEQAPPAADPAERTPKRPGTAWLPALTGSGLVAVLLSWAFPFAGRIGTSVSDWGWTTPMLALGIAGPLAVGCALLGLRGRSPRAVALAGGLVLGAALSLTHLLASQGAELLRFDITFRPGFSLLVVGWLAAAAAAALALGSAKAGARPPVPLGLRIACSLVVASLGVAWAIAEGLGSFYPPRSRFDWVILVAAALLVTSLRWTALQRITVLTGVTLLGIWLVYVALQALIRGFDSAGAVAVLVSVSVALAACYGAQMGSRTWRSEAFQVGAARR
jgi:hypothetical protein